MKKLNCSIACGLALVTLGTYLSPTADVVLAKDVSRTTLSTGENKLPEAKLKNLAKEYNEVSLVETSFNKANQSIQVQNEDHGTISTEKVATTVNFIINSDLVATGYNSISTMEKDLGKEVTRKFVEKNIMKHLIAQLESLGINFSGTLLEQAIDKIISSTADSGQNLAKWLDSIDKIPNNGYIEWA